MVERISKDKTYINLCAWQVLHKYSFRSLVTAAYYMPGMVLYPGDKAVSVPALLEALPPSLPPLFLSSAPSMGNHDFEFRFWLNCAKGSVISLDNY